MDRLDAVTAEKFSFCQMNRDPGKDPELAEPGHVPSFEGKRGGRKKEGLRIFFDHVLDFYGKLPERFLAKNIFTA